MNDSSNNAGRRAIQIAVICFVVALTVCLQVGGAAQRALKESQGLSENETVRVPNTRWRIIAKVHGVRLE
jgi:hypothetical protein